MYYFFFTFILLLIFITHTPVDDIDKGFTQSLDVLPIKVGGRLVQGQHSAVTGEGFGQRHSDDQGSEYFLSRATPEDVKRDFSVNIFKYF